MMTVRALGFALWLLATTFAASSLTAWHWIAIPVLPGRSVPRAQGDGRWHMTHYLSRDCACSQAVARHLERRGPLAGVVEEIVFVGSAPFAAPAGFRTHSINPGADASDEGIEGVPVLKITAPDGATQFVGSYRKHGESPDRFHETEILSDLRSGRPAPEYKVYGCAVSLRLKRDLDPLSLKSLKLR